MYVVKIGSLADMYHFVHVFSPQTTRRSVRDVHPKHHVLMAEEKVRVSHTCVCAVGSVCDDTLLRWDTSSSRW